jgi:hypothetical protein
MLVSFYFRYQLPLIPLQVIACTSLLSYLIKTLLPAKKEELATR